MPTVDQLDAQIKAVREQIEIKGGDSYDFEELASLLKARDKQRSFDRQMEGLDRPVTMSDDHSHYANVTGGPGDAFIQSEQWKSVDKTMLSWSTGAVDVGGLHYKAGTLLEGSGGQGAGLNPVPYLETGIVQKLLNPLNVADIFGQATTTTTPVRYMIEGTATSAAAGVAEGAAKPESDFTVSTTDEPVKKLATVLSVSDELLEDGPSVQAYVNSRLSLFVRLEEERQLLRGGGTNDLVGVFGRTGINTTVKAAGEDNTSAIARVIADTAGSAFLAPDAIIMHPSNWKAARLLRDGAGGTVGQYLGGGPFSGAYGNAGAPGMFGQTLWNLPVVLSTYVGAGTALVGNFRQGATIYRRGGVTVEASSSHSDYFQKNLSMIRAESRLALAVFRPGAFTACASLT